MESLATADCDFFNGLLNQTINIAMRKKEMEEAGTNFVLSMIKGIQPRDQVETMLAMQMAAIHNATMNFAQRLNHVETIPQQDSAERALTAVTSATVTTPDISAGPVAETPLPLSPAGPA